MDDEFLATAYPKVLGKPEAHNWTNNQTVTSTPPVIVPFTEVSSSKPSLLVTPPPINTEATTITTSLPEITPFIALQLRVARLEQEMSEVKKTDHSADVLASIRSQVPTAVDNYLGTKLDDALLKVLERHTADLIEKYSALPGPESVKNQESEKSPKEIIKAKKEQGEEKQDSTYSIRSTDEVDLEEFDLKSALFSHMNKKKSANRNTTNYRLYHALMEALIADEDAMDKEVADKVKDHKRKHDSDDDEDDDDDEGPSAGSNQGRSTKRRRSDSAASGSAKPPPKADDQSSKKPRESEASASKQHPTLSSTGWQITDTREAGVDSSMHRSDPESEHSEQSSDDISMQDEGNDSDMEDTDNAHIPKVSTTTWFKPIPESERPATPEPEWTIPPNDFPEPEHNWANAYATTYKVPEENKLQRKTYDIGSFIKWFCRRTGKKKLCKADLEGPAFNLVKAFHKNSVFLQYQMDECHKLLTNKVDLSNPEGHQIPQNINEPLPLGGPPGQVTIQPQFFFNKDLDYLLTGDKERKIALSISKLKAARYLDFGLEELVPSLWVESEHEYDISAVYGITHWWFRRKEFYINKHSESSDREAVRSQMRILSVISVKVFEKYGYNYLREIILRRADYQEYKILEKDFKNLYPNDFEDLFLLNIQEKLNHLPKTNRQSSHQQAGGLGKWSEDGQEKKRKRLHHSTREKGLQIRRIYRSLELCEEEYELLNTGGSIELRNDMSYNQEDTYPILLSFIHCGNKSILRVLRIILVMLPEHPSETIVFHNEDGNLARANIKQALGYFKDGDGDGNSLKKFIQKFYQLLDDNEEIKAKEDDDPDNIIDIFKIEGNLFDYETSLCKALNDFNYLLKIDKDLFTFDIQGIGTYEEYELNNPVTKDLEEPCSDIDGFCYDGELHGMVRVGSMTYFQDHKCFGNFQETSPYCARKVPGRWWKVNAHEVATFTCSGLLWAETYCKTSKINRGMKNAGMIPLLNHQSANRDDEDLAIKKLTLWYTLKKTCVELNQHDDAPVVPEPVLEDEDEDPKEDEFKEEEDPQKEDDMEIDIEEDENEPELTYPYEEVDPLNPSPSASESEPDDEIEIENLIEHEDETVPISVYEVGESSTAVIPREDGDRLLPAFMRRDIDSLFGRMLILDWGNEVRSSVEQGTAAMEKLVEKLGNVEEKAECPLSKPQGSPPDV
ncbi:hypothetical protein Tco_0408070 [Tanacetum coccineum]